MSELEIKIQSCVWLQHPPNITTVVEGVNECEI